MDSSTSTTITWSMAARVWWSLTWRTLVFIFPAVFIVGLVIGTMMAIADVPPGPYILLAQLAGAIISLVMSIWIIKTLLSKRYSTFSITVTRHQPDGYTD
ncbi:SoxR reducing system RseC family protein [Salinimonas sp. HHU 13199]|uniref:SoxR reducing system RseC family protein n=1 Tax=Salinimonas profundi TaxID=2729140 RepID=A0ABR8LEH3_9ALTE|nr:hypothetical protein [Salinimonas profundi]MBD3584688.1 SoxR reducing system RseC family protein [Salinimonas profundi]